MRELTSAEIEKLASRPAVRRIAVENFLGTMGLDHTAAMVNLRDDARAYRWNGATQNAIAAGINLARYR